MARKKNKKETPDFEFGGEDEDIFEDTDDSWEELDDPMEEDDEDDKDDNTYDDNRFQDTIDDITNRITSLEDRVNQLFLTDLKPTPAKAVALFEKAFKKVTKKAAKKGKKNKK